MIDGSPFPEGSVAKELTSEKAIQMAEVALIHNDLNTCIRSLRLIKERYLADDLARADQDIKLALFRDAVTLFVEAFVGTGFKLTLGKVYSGVGHQEFFKWARDVRDTYAAHSFGPMRQCSTVVAIDPTTGKVIGVGPFRMDLDIVNKEAVHELGKAAMIAGRYAEQLGRLLNDELLQEAVSTPLDELAKLHPAKLHVPDPSEYRMGRAAFRALKSGDQKPLRTLPKRQRRRLSRLAKNFETPSDRKPD